MLILPNKDIVARKVWIQVGKVLSAPNVFSYCGEEFIARAVFLLQNFCSSKKKYKIDHITKTKNRTKKSHCVVEKQLLHALELFWIFVGSTLIKLYLQFSDWFNLIYVDLTTIYKIYL